MKEAIGGQPDISVEKVSLSPLELGVLKCAAQGLSIEETAQVVANVNLDRGRRTRTLAPKTIKNGYRAKLINKLDAVGITGAVVNAV